MILASRSNLRGRLAAFGEDVRFTWPTPSSGGAQTAIAPTTETPTATFNPPTVTFDPGAFTPPPTSTPPAACLPGYVMTPGGCQAIGSGGGSTSQPTCPDGYYMAPSGCQPFPTGGDSTDWTTIYYVAGGVAVIGLLAAAFFFSRKK